MTDLPSHVEIHEEGPREGFQIEPGPIPTADKIRLIEALSETGLHHIQACSFVNTRLVPGWADAEAVVAGFEAKPGVEYTGLFFNGNGLDRALFVRGVGHGGRRVLDLDLQSVGLDLHALRLNTSLSGVEALASKA